MQTRYYLARLRGASDRSGIVLPDLGDEALAEERAAEADNPVRGSSTMTRRSETAGCRMRIWPGSVPCLRHIPTSAPPMPSGYSF